MPRLLAHRERWTPVCALETLAEPAPYGHCRRTVATPPTRLRPTLGRSLYWRLFSNFTCESPLARSHSSIVRRDCTWHPASSCSPANRSAWAIRTSWPIRFPTACSTPCFAQDPYSRVACETMVTTGVAIVAGEITTKAVVDYSDSRPQRHSRGRLHRRRDGHLRRHLRGDGLDRRAEPRHRHGRRTRTSDGQGDRRRRPGADVRLRLQRHARADAAADRAGAPHPQPADRSPASKAKSTGCGPTARAR